MNHLRPRLVANGFFRPICQPWRSHPAFKFSSSGAAEEEEVEIEQRKLPTDFDPATFDPTEHRSPPTERVFRLVDEVADLTLLEVSDLSEILMKRLGITELPVMAALKPGAAAAIMPASGKAEAKPAVAAEKTAYDLRLEGFDPASKIKVIKEVRAITDLGLKEAKELVEKAPTVLKKGVSKEEGEQILEKLKAAGAKAVLD